MKPGSDTIPTLVYGTVRDQFLVMPESWARRLAAEHRALATAQTWSELLERVPDLTVEVLAGSLEVAEEDLDLDDDVDADALAQGTVPWPRSLGSDVAEWFDSEGLRDLYEEFGHVEANSLGQDCASLPADAATELTERLRRLGHVLVEDSVLLRQASGDVVSE